MSMQANLRNLTWKTVSNSNLRLFVKKEGKCAVKKRNKVGLFFSLMFVFCGIVGIAYAISVSAELSAKEFSNSIISSIIYLLLGALITILLIWDTKRVNKLIDEGYCIRAQIDRIESSHFRDDEGYYDVILYCSYTYPNDGTFYSFISEPLYMKHEPQISDKTVLVYVDRNDSTKYYVDIEEFRERNNF